jgi:kynureninase
MYQPTVASTVEPAVVGQGRATLADIVRMDRADPLRHLRARFDLPAGVLYMCGNSLGALPRNVAARVADVVQRQWGESLIRSWNAHSWFVMPERLGQRLSALIGAQAHEVTVADSTSVNLFKAACCARSLRPQRRKIVTEMGNFPTDAYVLQGLTQLLGPGSEYLAVARDQVLDAADADTAVLVLTHVHYKDSAMYDMAEVTRRAHERGALVIWDLSHSVGAVSVDLNACNADFAVGCTYKYLNGGPGAPAFIFAAERHHAAMNPGLVGWWGHEQPFEFSDTYRPAAGMRRTLTGTGPILGFATLDAALDVFDGVSMAAVRDKSLRLSSLFMDLVADKCAGFGLTAITARDSIHRGSHVALTHADGFSIMQALIRRQVIGDFRAPDVLRFGLTPLYLSYRDVWDAVEMLSQVLLSGEWKSAAHNHRAQVT